MLPRSHSLRDLLTASLFTAIVALPPVLHLLQTGPDDAGIENRRLAEAPTLADLRADWPAFPEKLNAWMGDRFGLRRTYLKLGFLADRALSSSSGRDAVRGDDGWLFTTLHGALALHQGLLPFAAGEADTWLDGLARIGARAEQAGAAFVAVVPPNKHTIYPEKLGAYPRKAQGEPRLHEVMRRARERGLPLVDLRDALFAAKGTGKMYFKTDTHWTDLGAYQGFLQLRALLVEKGVAVPDIPQGALEITEDPAFRGDIYGLLGEENGAPETDPQVRIRPDPSRKKAGSLLIIGDSFTWRLLKYLEASFDTVTFEKNAAGAPDLSAIAPGTYDVVIFEIVERYLSRRLTPVAAD